MQEPLLGNSQNSSSGAVFVSTKGKKVTPVLAVALAMVRLLPMQHMRRFCGFPCRKLSFSPGLYRGSCRRLGIILFYIRITPFGSQCHTPFAIFGHEFFVFRPAIFPPPFFCPVLYCCHSHRTTHHFQPKRDCFYGRQR